MGGDSCGFSSCRDVSPQSPPTSGGRKSGGAEAGLGRGDPTYSGAKPWTHKTLWRGRVPQAGVGGVTAHGGQTRLGTPGSRADVPSPGCRQVTTGPGTAGAGAGREARPPSYSLSGAGSSESPRGSPQISNLLSCVQIPVLPPPGCVTWRSHFTSLAQGSRGKEQLG